jgi:integrase/recombinase XerD
LVGSRWPRQTRSAHACTLTSGGSTCPRTPAERRRLAGLPIARRTSHGHHRVGSDDDLRPGAGFEFDEAQLAAVSFLARYGGRTFEAHRHDLRDFFQWAADNGVAVLGASRAHIELFRAWMEDRGLAASTIDRRLSTVCGFYRFAHIDGRIRSNPAQYVRRPQVYAPDARGLDRSELGVFLFTADQFDRDHAALVVLLGLNGLRVSEACATDIEDLGFERGHRTLRIMGKGSKPATVPLVPRTGRTSDLAVGERHEGPILRRRDGQRLDRRTAHRWVRSIGERAGLGAVHPHMLRAAFIMAALDAGVPLRDVQIAARHADPCTTTIYDRRRQNFDRHAAYVVALRSRRLSPERGSPDLGCDRRLGDRPYVRAHEGRSVFRAAPRAGRRRPRIDADRARFYSVLAEGTEAGGSSGRGPGYVESG